ncbi:MAG: hypothetical protein LUD69_05835 [Oscillospiraceae bacterium]|nr:hypothetical protein [Oscillospiraceae bacterium]
MTRDEFCEIDTWYELLEFCDEVDYDHNDVFIWDELCNWVDGEIRDRIQQVEWTEVRDFLDGLPQEDAYTVYIQDDDYDFCGSDDDDRYFREYKDLVEDWCDGEDLFDDEEEDEDDEWDGDDCVDEEPLRTPSHESMDTQESLEPEPVSFAELFEGGATIRSFVQKNQRPERNERPDEIPLPW